MSTPTTTHFVQTGTVCGKCGGFIPSGTTHVCCNGLSTQYTFPVTYTYSYDAAILEELKAIRALLEKMSIPPLAKAVGAGESE